MKELAADKRLVAYCGLYCGVCGAYRPGRGSGSLDNRPAHVVALSFDPS